MARCSRCMTNNWPPRQHSFRRLEQVVSHVLGPAAGNLLVCASTRMPHLCYVGCRQVWKFHRLTQTDPLQLPQRQRSIQCYQQLSSPWHICAVWQTVLPQLAHCYCCHLHAACPTSAMYAAGKSVLPDLHATSPLLLCSSARIAHG